jgi:hypothetical protein
MLAYEPRKPQSIESEAGMGREQRKLLATNVLWAHVLAVVRLQVSLILRKYCNILDYIVLQVLLTCPQSSA